MLEDRSETDGLPVLVRSTSEGSKVKEIVATGAGSSACRAIRRAFMKNWRKGELMPGSAARAGGSAICRHFIGGREQVANLFRSVLASRFSSEEPRKTLTGIVSFVQQVESWAVKEFSLTPLSVTEP